MACPGHAVLGRVIPKTLRTTNLQSITTKCKQRLSLGRSLGRPCPRRHALGMLSLAGSVPAPCERRTYTRKHNPSIFMQWGWELSQQWSSGEFRQIKVCNQKGQKGSAGRLGHAPQFLSLRSRNGNEFQVRSNTLASHAHCKTAKFEFALRRRYRTKRKQSRYSIARGPFGSDRKIWICSVCFKNVQWKRVCLPVLQAAQRCRLGTANILNQIVEVILAHPYVIKPIWERLAPTSKQMCHDLWVVPQLAAF